MEKNNPASGDIEVTVTAIDGDDLLLETIPQKQIIRWPLKNIPRPLEIGARLTIRLQQKSPAQNNLVGDIALETCESSDQKEDQMRRLLEQLVN